MGEFSGAEPLVGEIAGLRTFRIDESGMLLPLYSDGAWYDGANTADCAPPTGSHRRAPHRVPADDCECGFYAYGSVEIARQNRHLRHVQAVVSCWGDVVAGTKGIRASRARIDALWISPAASPSLRTLVATRYPSARIYADADAMLAEHPLTELPCYTTPPRRRVAPRVAGVLGSVALLALGLLPFEMVHENVVLWAIWLMVTAAIALTTGWLMVGTHGAGHLAAAFVAAGLLAWLLAPVFGVAGWLLRVPLLRGIAVAGGGYLLALRPRHFPVVATGRQRGFYGVRV